MSLSLDVSLRLEILPAPYGRDKGKPVLRIAFVDRDGYVSESSEILLENLAAALKPHLS